MAESRDEVVTSAPGFKAAGSSLGSSLLDGPIFITVEPWKYSKHRTSFLMVYYFQRTRCINIYVICKNVKQLKIHSL